MATLLSHYNYNTFKVAFCTSVLGIILLYGCGKTTSENTDKKKVGTGSIVLVDAFNDTTILDKPAQRVMGLAPGITELLYASLPNDSLICAVTHVCNYPLSAKLKPTISTYPLHFEGILNVKPDLIFSEEGIIHLDDIHKLRLMGFKVFQ